MIFDRFFDRSGARADLSFSPATPAEAAFAAYYTTTIRPELEKIEDERLLKHAEVMRRLEIANFVFIAICAGFGIGIAGILIWMNSDSIFETFKKASDFLWVLIFIAAAAFGGIYYLIQLPLRPLQKHLKNFIIEHSFRFFGNLEFFPEQEMDDDRIRKIDCLPNFNRYRCDEYIRGKYKNLPVQIAEVHLEHKTGSGKNSSIKTVFKGLIVIISQERDIKNETIIIHNSNNIEFSLENLFSGKSLERVELEDVRFKKELTVYSGDQIEARYILTPSFMESFLALEQHFRSSGHLNSDISIPELKISFPVASRALAMTRSYPTKLLIFY